MWTQKLYFIPLNVAVWLQDIRKSSEGDDELDENVTKGDGYPKLNSSTDSIYDNVELSTGKPDETKSRKAFEKEKIIERNSHLTWPLRSRETKTGSLSGFWKSDGIFSEEDEIIHFNSLSNALSIGRRDITHRRRHSGESRTQEGEEPKLRASMSNLLASHREKHTQECSWTWLNAEKIILGDVAENEGADFEKILKRESEERGNFAFKWRLKTLPASFVSDSGLNVNSIFDSEFVTEKPPVAPKRRKRKMSQKCSPQALQNRRLRKAHLSKAKPFAIPTVCTRTSKDASTCANLPDRSDCGLAKKDSDDGHLFDTSGNNELADKEAKKPLPFPAYDPELEYEINELLMMQRVTESSKERRRISIKSKASPILEDSNDIFQGCVKNIPETRRSPHGVQSSSKSIKDNMSESDLSEFIGGLSRAGVDEECNAKVKRFLESRKKKLEYRTIPKVPVKLREDIIIDWENDYENLNEPVVLEGKSVGVRKFLDVYWRPKLQLAADSDCLSLRTSTSCNFSDDETFEKTVGCSDDMGSGFSNDEMSSVISDVSLPSQSSRQSLRSVSKTTKGQAPSEITEIVTLYEKILKESDPKCDTEISDKISFSSISEGLNSYSDFESDINETIAIGEIWYGEKLSEENASVISWDVSEDASRSSDRRGDDDDENDSDSLTHWKLYTTKIEHKFETVAHSNLLSEVKLDTITEDEDKLTEVSCSGAEEEQKTSRVKSSSETNLPKLTRSMPPPGRWKSSDFFRDSSTEDRLMRDWKKRDSITSDVCEWMAKIRGIAFAEDQLFSNDDEWILSFDSEERAYFFEESSKKSLWALPDYSKEEAKPESSYPIQRSATESAITNETSTKLRLNKDGGKGRISASTRSSKAQSMLIEPKLDLSPKDGSKTFSMPRDLSKIYGEIIRIGVLNKTKILENGKKLRKNWTPSFVVLTDSYLFFFKDAKSFQNMKNIVGSNGNHMCLSLQGAVIEKGDKISSRKNVYKISCSDNTDVLIQTDKSSEAEEWFKEIGSVIQKLPQDSTVGGSPLLDSKSPSKVGRTKSLKVRSKDTGSMEDLSSTPEERQNKIKARLKKFFIRRPTVDSLKKKGIWKDEPVFGCSLEQITKNRNPRVPVFVEKCIECIESKEENMKTDGLYRASGNLSQVQKIRLEVDQNNLNIMKEEEDVHVLTGSLKLFFRELKEPLIPSKQLEPALLATDKHTRKEKIKDFQKIVKSLPTPNYDTLKFLLQHLLRVKEYHKFNRMNINNLAIVFGPTLMWPEQESANMALELMQQNVVIECLLKEFQEIFT